jgi:hypothetical protein
MVWLYPTTNLDTLRMQRTAGERHQNGRARDSNLFDHSPAMICHPVIITMHQDRFEIVVTRAAIVVAGKVPIFDEGML